MKQYEEDQKFDDTLKSYQAIELGDKGKKELHARMMSTLANSKIKKQKRDMRPVLATLVAGMLLLFGGYYLAAEVIFSEGEKQGNELENIPSSYEDLEKKIAEVLQTSVYIPYHEDLPLKSVFLMNVNMNGERQKFVPFGVTLAYSTLEADEKDADEYEELKKSELPGEIIYGEYLRTEKQMAQVSIFNGEKTQIDDIKQTLTGEQKTVGEHNVRYKLFETEPYNTLRLSLQIDNNVYVFNFLLAGEVTEEYAYSFVEKSLNQIKRR